MKLPFFISKKYFFSLKNNNVVNILSGISILGILISTISMFVVFSVFSGLEESTSKLMSKFDPDIKITPKKGKFFNIEKSKIFNLKKIDNVKYLSQTLEDKVLLKYQGRDYIANIKGVEEDYLKKEKILKSLKYGKWFPYKGKRNFIVMGSMVGYSLGVPKSQSMYPVKIFYPNRDASLGDIEDVFYKKLFHNRGIFNIEKDINSKYVLTSLDKVKELFKTDDISSIEIELKNSSIEGIKKLKTQIEDIIGNDFDIKTLEEQNEFFYKMMNTEKLVSFGVFILVMIIALFNIIGSIVMLILDKKENIRTLINLGLKVKEIQKIFIYQGVLITVTGCFLGIVLGVSLVTLQIEYGFITMEYTGMTYPLKFEWSNFFQTVLTMLLLGIMSSYISVKYILKKNIIKKF